MAVKNFGIIIDENVQKEFKDVVRTEHNKVRGVYGLEVENAMKLYTTLKGSDKYRDDPGVIAMLSKVRKMDDAHTHTKHSSDVSDIERKVDEIVKDFELINEKINGIERKVKGDNNKKTGSMSEFKRQFQMAYHDYSQVSRRDIERFVMNNYDIRDQRSVNNRINFLIAQDVLVPYAQNVYNLQK